MQCGLYLVVLLLDDPSRFPLQLIGSFSSLTVSVSLSLSVHSIPIPHSGVLQPLLFRVFSYIEPQDSLSDYVHPGIACLVP